MPKNLLSVTGATALLVGVCFHHTAIATEPPAPGQRVAITLPAEGESAYITASHAAAAATATVIATANTDQSLANASESLAAPTRSLPPSLSLAATTENAVIAARELSARLNFPADDKRDASSAPDVIASIEKPKLFNPSFSSGRIPFTVRIGGVDTSWSTMPAFVMPGGVLEFSASNGKGPFTASAPAGKMDATGSGAWKWTAPAAPGDHTIRVQDVASGARATIEVFVLRPYDGNGQIGSYRIGEYQKAAKDGNPKYTAPAGFIEVTAQNVDRRLSPHFRLGQFLCKDTAKFPKYVALQTALLVKLETLIEALAERGLPAETLHVMSGYRTPAYNAGIGNETTYSRHTYGDAADVFLDRDGDGKMDDVNHDGASTEEDAAFLYQLVEGTLEAKLPTQLAGGLATYKPNASHGPFVHIDTRGHKARW